MPLTLQTIAQIQQSVAAQYNANAALPANTAAGSTLGAIFNAFALSGVTIEGQIAYINQVSRLLTSTGADIDSFCSVFGVVRNVAVSATTTVVLSTPSPVVGTAISIPVGTIVQTNLQLVSPSASPSPIQFQIIADLTQAGYNSGTNSYVINPGASSVTATVSALVPGSAGNVAANQITTIVSTSANPAPAAISSVNNTSAATGGVDAETDVAYIARFQAFMANRWATDSALLTAVNGAQAGLTYLVGDQLDAFGNALPYNVTIVVGQVPAPGAGGTPAAVITTVQNAVLTARPAGIPVNVVGPTMTSINVTALLTLAAGAVAANVQSAAALAVNTYINNLGLANNSATSAAGAALLTTTCSYSQIVAALASTSGVKSASNVLVNGAGVDIVLSYGTQAYGVAVASGFTTQ